MIQRTRSEVVVSAFAGWVPGFGTRMGERGENSLLGVRPRDLSRGPRDFLRDFVAGGGFRGAVRVGGCEPWVYRRRMSDDLVLTPDAERVLEVAGRLFYDNGIHAVGVERIADEAGVTQEALHGCFGSKDELIGHYVKRWDERYREHVRAVVERRGRISPARRLLLVFDAVEEWIATENPRGCVFVNAQAELPDAGHPAREVIRAQKQWMLDYLRTLARDAGVRNARKLATSLLILLEGAVVTASFGVVPGAVGNAKEVARQLVETC